MRHVRPHPVPVAQDALTRTGIVLIAQFWPECILRQEAWVWFRASERHVAVLEAIRTGGAIARLPAQLRCVCNAMWESMFDALRGVSAWWAWSDVVASVNYRLAEASPSGGGL